MNLPLLPKSFLVLDRSSAIYAGDILYPFAVDEILCRKVGEGHPPVVHIWRHQKAFVLGLRDRRLPGALAAMDWLEQQGYRIAVRNSGGAAVPLDPGVVNLSFILPSGGRTIGQDFELAYGLMASLLEMWSVRAEKGEIAGAYCPGDYDVSIAGKKFCGISQRRQLKAAIVQMFILVEGRGAERASLVRAFYEVASAGRDGNYPSIDPSKTASLEELAGIPSVEAFMVRLHSFLGQMGGMAWEPDAPVVHGEEVERTIAIMRDRYEKR